MADQTADRELKNALAQIEKQFGKGAIMQLGDKSAMAGVLSKMHTPIYFYDRNLTRATAVLDQSLALYREVGNIEGIADVLVNQGNLIRDQGRRSAAEIRHARVTAR